MIKAIFFIIEPSRTWEKIVLAQKSMAQVLFLFLLPTILVSVGGEMAGIFYWGTHQTLTRHIQIPQSRLLIYAAAEVVLDFALVFLGAKLLKAFTETFQERYTYQTAFKLVAYSLAPFFLVHLLDAVPNINPWITFAIGMILAISAIYSGVPRLLQPDPPHAFGVFLTSAIMLSGIAGLARLASLLILTGPMTSFSPLG